MWHKSADATVRQMKRKLMKLVVFSMVIMAFFVMPVNAQEKRNTISGEMGGYKVNGYVVIGDSYAAAGTDSTCPYATVEVSLTYYYTNESTGTIESSSVWNGRSVTVDVSKTKPTNCRSYKATSTHKVSFGDYTWNPPSIDVYY